MPLMRRPASAPTSTSRSVNAQTGRSATVEGSKHDRSISLPAIKIGASCLENRECAPRCGARRAMTSPAVNTRRSTSQHAEQIPASHEVSVQRQEHPQAGTSDEMPPSSANTENSAVPNGSVPQLDSTPASCGPSIGRGMTSLNQIMRQHGYIEIKKIGEGSYGKALLVDDQHKIRYVCKVADVSRASTKEKNDAWKEGQVLSQLKHPYIVKYKESFIAGDWMCISMEYCAGADLSRRIQSAKTTRQPLVESQVSKWFTQATMAVKYIHECHILHRDLKPENMFITREGNLKLGDFGVARMLECTAACARTQIGTPYYLSPEVCKGMPYSSPSDVWALGCTLYEMCSLSKPFDAPNIQRLVRKICGDSTPRIPDTYSDELQQRCQEMLRKGPTERVSCKAVLTTPHIRSVIKEMLKESRSKPESLSLTTPSPAHDGLFGNGVLETRAATEPTPDLCRTAAISLSRCINETMRSRSCTNQVGVSAPMVKEEEEAMRKLYLQCIKDHPTAIFSQLALPLQEDLMKSDIGAQLLQGCHRNVTVSFGNNTITMEKEMFSIGRWPVCDVILPHQSDFLSTSRMQLWIFNLPGGIVVVDGWSCAGTSVVELEVPSGEKFESLPGARRAFMLPHGEAATLCVGGKTSRITLNAKLCIICEERHRSMRLRCGHQALCRQCALGQAHGVRLSECPICREPIQDEPINASSACVGRTYEPNNNNCARTSAQ